MLEGNGDAAVGVFDIENHGVAANLAPVPDDAESVIAGRHDAGQVNGADFKIFVHRNRLLDDGCGKNSRDGNLLARFKNVAGAIAVTVADGVAEFRRSEIRRAAQILPGNIGDRLAALRGVNFNWCSRLRHNRRRGNFPFGSYVRHCRLQAGSLRHGLGTCGCAAKADEKRGLTRTAATPNKAHEMAATVRTEERRTNFLREILIAMLTCVPSCG